MGKRAAADCKNIIEKQPKTAVSAECKHPALVLILIERAVLDNDSTVLGCFSSVFPKAGSEAGLRAVGSPAVCYNGGVKSNEMTVTFDKPLDEVFAFTTQAPNTKYWLTGVIDETIDTEEVQVGTVHTLTTEDGGGFQVSVIDFKECEHIEWLSAYENTHCRYTYTVLEDNTVEMEYHEWVKDGELDEPLLQSALEKLKRSIEAS